LDERNAILKAAETEWIDYERAAEIVNSLHAESCSDGDDDDDDDDAAAAERSEPDDILAGAPPELPPPPEPIPIDCTLQECDQAVRTLHRLSTKSVTSFTTTAHGPEVIEAVREFMGSMASHLKQSEAQPASEAAA
jgi:hypothetical protein